MKIPLIIGVLLAGSLLPSWAQILTVTETATVEGVSNYDAQVGDTVTLSYVLNLSDAVLDPASSSSSAGYFFSTPGSSIITATIGTNVYTVNDRAYVGITSAPGDYGYIFSTLGTQTTDPTFGDHFTIDLPSTDSEVSPTLSLDSIQQFPKLDFTVFADNFTFVLNPDVSDDHEVEAHLDSYTVTRTDGPLSAPEPSTYGLLALGLLVLGLKLRGRTQAARI